MKNVGLDLGTTLIFTGELNMLLIVPKDVKLLYAHAANVCLAAFRNLHCVGLPDT